MALVRRWRSLVIDDEEDHFHFCGKYRVRNATKMHFPAAVVSIRKPKAQVISSAQIVQSSSWSTSFSGPLLQQHSSASASDLASTLFFVVQINNGNPIEIAAVVVWRVVDTAEALFHVDDFTDFVHVQSEAAIRNLALNYPYDPHVEGEIALRSHTPEIAEHLKDEIQERLEQAGVEVLEARISHLAYAPEIAHAMLQRQQATAVIAARQKIVEGAVGMVEMALDRLSHQKIVELDNDKKAAMIGNLLVVLCSDRGTQPVVNAGKG